LIQRETMQTFRFAAWQ